MRGLRVYLVRARNLAAVALVLAVPAAGAMLLVDALPRQWRSAASTLFVTVAVLGVVWALAVRHQPPEARRVAGRRMAVVGGVVATAALVSGFVARPNQDLAVLVGALALVAGLVWIPLAGRRRDN